MYQKKISAMQVSSQTVLALSIIIKAPEQAAGLAGGLACNTSIVTQHLKSIIPSLFPYLHLLKCHKT